jgi:hypothetical protein
MSKQGVFLDTVGIAYRCGDIKGTTGVDYTYHYDPGTAVVFSIGSLVIGEAIGRPLLTISDLVPANTSTFDPKLINRARLLYSLTPALGFETPITIDTNVGGLKKMFLSPHWLTAYHRTTTGP